MTHILKNKNLEIQIDNPLENYNFSRFDWTGKIVSVKYKDILVSSLEKLDNSNFNVIFLWNRYPLFDKKIIYNIYIYT